MRVLKDVEEDGIATIAIAGTLDLYSTPEVKGRLNAWYEKGVKKYLVDMTLLEHVDSSGLAALINWHSFLEERQGRSVLYGAHGAVKRIIELTDLDQRIFVMQNREQALRVLNKV